MAGIAEYDRLDALALAALIRRGELTATEVLEEAISRAEQFNPTINAITARLYEQGRAMAKAPLPAGPLSGVPFLLKDIGALMTGTVSTGSTKLLADIV